MKKINIDANKFFNVVMYVLAITMTVLAVYKTHVCDKQERYIKKLENSYDILHNEFEDYINTTFKEMYPDELY